MNTIFQRPRTGVVFLVSHETKTGFVALNYLKNCSAPPIYFQKPPQNKAKLFHVKLVEVFKKQSF